MVARSTSVSTTARAPLANPAAGGSASGAVDVVDSSAGCGWPWTPAVCAAISVRRAGGVSSAAPGRLPEQPYTREALQAYLDHCRQKSQATFEALTDEKANQICKFPWDGGEEISFAELQLYNMRHIQEHASQLSLHLGHKAGFAPDWVPKAGHKDA